MAVTLSKHQEFVAAVDECRRLQILTPKPPNLLQAKMIRQAEAKVDALLVELRAPELVDQVLTDGPGAAALPVS